MRADGRPVAGRATWVPCHPSTRLALLATARRSLAEAATATCTRRPQAQAEFKAHLRPLLRQVATAFPQATVELWAVDEHRIGLKPILRRVWTLPGQRPIAPVEHRDEWRYLVGFVHPASGRTVWHLATTVNIELFSVELAAFAREVGAGPTKQIVLVLDGAGWHESPKVRVPEHVVARQEELLPPARLQNGS